MFVMMCGISGSGKSTCARKESDRLNSSSKELNSVIISSDSIRKELYGDECIQGDPKEVFAIMKKRTFEEIAKQHTVFYDATNLSAKKRTAIVKEIKSKYPYILCQCVIMAVREEICIQRQSMRNRVVSAEVIEEQVRHFQVPYYNEGWDIISVISEHDFDINDYLLKDCNVFQHNPHHLLTISNHCQVSSRIAEKLARSMGLDANLLSTAAKYHDVGKLITKTFFDSHGNYGKRAHYYNHSNVGAYLWLCSNKSLNFDIDSSLMIAALIQWHMQPYFVKDIGDWLEKRNFDTVFQAYLRLINEADAAAK